MTASSLLPTASLQIPTMEDDQNDPLVVNTNEEELVHTASNFKAGAAESGSHQNEGATVSSLFDRQMRHVHKHASYCISVNVHMCYFSFSGSLGPK